MLEILLCLVISYFISGFIATLYYLSLCYDDQEPFEKNVALRIFLSGFKGLFAAIVTELIYEDDYYRDNKRKK